MSRPGRNLIFSGNARISAPLWAVPRGTEGVRIMIQAVAESMPVADCLAGTGLTESTLADEHARSGPTRSFGWSAIS